MKVSRTMVNGYSHFVGALNQLGKNDQRLFELLVQLDLIDIDPPALTVN